MLTALKEAKKDTTVASVHGQTDPAEAEPMPIRSSGTVSVGTIIPRDTRNHLKTLLDEYVDAFSWDTKDLTGVPPHLAVHKLEIDPSQRPIKQKRRVFAPERVEAIRGEVNKLLEADVIEEVFYPEWIANPVMVKKT